jgi:type III secretion protein Q
MPLGVALATPARGPVRRICLAPVRKLDRAHLALERRPQTISDAQRACDAIAAQLREQLNAPVSITARLADVGRQALTQLSSRGVFVLLELHADALAVLELDPACVAALLQHAAGSSERGAGALRLTGIEEAALGWALLTALAATRSVPAIHERFAPRLLSLHTDRAQLLDRLDCRRRHLAIALDLVIGDQHGAGRLLLPATWLELLLLPLPEAPIGALHPAVAAAAIEATCLVGLMSVTRAEAATFSPGDVLVFPGVASKAHLLGPARLVSASFELLGAFGPDGFTLTAACPRERELRMSHNEQDPTLPVDVEIELTRLRLPLHQLGALKPGAVLPLHLTAAQTVVVRVGDRAVARAELVEVNGEVGARILSMIESPQ